ncbi:MAG: hypothetical protein HQL56_18560 [Magnetococcales bacterium]|nr:hypothetical protein [Magnetococcales bacterium]
MRKTRSIRDLLIPVKPLPENYKGYSPEELIQVLEMINTDKGAVGVPKEKIGAMRDMIREYRMTPGFKIPPGENEIVMPYMEDGYFPKRDSNPK